MHHAAAPTDPLTLLEWHESPVPLRLTVARATLCPTVGFLKMWGSPEDKAQLSARADLQLLPCRLSLDLTCKEAVLGGRLSATLPAGRLEYRRRFRLPNGMVLALGAGAQHEGGSNGRSGGGSGDSSGGGRRRRHRFRPFLGCQLQLAAGGADGGGGEEVVVSERGFSDKHRFALPTRCGGLSLAPMDFEVASTLSLPSGLLPGLPSPAGLASLGSAASLQGRQNSLGGGSLPDSPSLPASLPGSSSSSSLPASPLASLPSLQAMPGTTPGLPLHSIDSRSSMLQGEVAAVDHRPQQQQQQQQKLDERRALSLHIERLALVVRL